MGSKQSKPGVDWNAIRQGFEAGTSIRQLAKAHAPLTHRAIQKRRDKEGWDTKSAIAAATERLPSVTAQATGLATTTTRTEEKARKVLDALQRGMPYRTAAALAGINEGTLINWREADPEFQALCDASIEMWHASKLIEIDAAGNRGDWKASAYRLERHAKTRSEYAGKDIGPGINITLNIGRSDQDKPSLTIEGTRADG